jgi:hypothetical protein
MRTFTQLACRFGVAATLTLTGCEAFSSLTGTPTGTAAKGFAHGGASDSLGPVRVFGQRGNAFITLRPFGYFYSTPELAFDGKLDTEYVSSAEKIGWVGVDLGAPTAVNQVKLTWKDEYGKRYRIQVSDDDVAWADVATKADGQGGTETITFPTTTTRYIRMWGDEPQSRYVVREMEVNGPDDPSKNLALGKRGDAMTICNYWFADEQRAAVDKLLVEGDRAYRAGQFSDAFAIYNRAMTAYGAGIRANFYKYDDLLVRMLSAEWRVKNPRAVGSRIIRFTTFVVPTTKATYTKSDQDLTPIPVERHLQESTVQHALDEFFWMNESYLALTDGKVGFENNVVRLPDHKVVKLTCWNANPRLTWPLQDAFEPDIRPECDKVAAQTDFFMLLWPGAEGDDTPQLNSGGISRSWVTVNGQEQYRPWIITWGDHKSEWNSLMLYHHEFYHEIENRYKQLGFPAEGHPFSRREDWPRTYIGCSEWEFYEQTLRGYVIPHDGLAGIEFKNGQYGNKDSGPPVMTTPAPTPTPLTTPEPTPTPAPTPTPDEEDLHHPHEVFTADQANDGDTDTHWASAPGASTAWLQLDLGRTTQIGHVKLYWDEDYASNYEVQAYRAPYWYIIGRRTSSYGTDAFNTSRFSARFIRVVGKRSGTGNGFGLREFEVYSSATSTTNLAEGARAKASSEKQ